MSPLPRLHFDDRSLGELRDTDRYQTNFMVYRPGSYRFNDYLKMGIPITLMKGVITVIVAPLVWPFTP